MKRFRILPLVLTVLSASGFAFKAVGQSLSFSLDRAGVPPVRYTIRVDQQTGKGTYRGEAAAQVAGTEHNAPAVETPLAVGPEVLKKLFAVVPLVQAGRCETHNKKIAQTGVKILRYDRAGVVTQCSYNYSDEDRLNAATGLFEALGETMKYGDRLAAKLRFDRLGLDVEMDNLMSALNDSRAVEIVNIAPVLQAIQNDDRVMERVRRKAAHLLEGAGVPAPAAAQVVAVPPSSAL